MAKVISDTGIIVTGLPHNFTEIDIIKNNDIIVLNNAQPLSAFVSGVAKCIRIPTIGFLSTAKVKTKDYDNICDKVIQGAEALTKELIYFLENGELSEIKNRRESDRKLP